MRWTTINTITLFKIRGRIRSCVEWSWGEFILPKVFNKKYKRTGSIIVSRLRESSFALIIGKGIYRGDFEK